MPPFPKVQIESTTVTCPQCGYQITRPDPSFYEIGGEFHVEHRHEQRLGPRIILTNREREIMALAAVGYSNKEIARLIRLSEGTVKIHLHKTFRKLRVSNRTSLARLSLRNAGFKKW